MKKLFFAIPILLFVLTSCRGGDDEIDNSFLVGTWNWISTDGGIANNIHETPTSTGKTVKLNFNSDNTYSVQTNGTTTSEGTFTLYKNISNLDHYERIYIDFSNDQDKMIKGNTETDLYLSDDANDGVTSHYQK